MTKLEQLHLFLKFHFAPWGAAKGEVWEAVTGDQAYSDENIERYVFGIMDGNTGFDDYQVKMLSIIADPGPPRDRQVAEQIAACQSGDIEAAHADADRLLVNLVNELGYKEAAQAWQSIDKWYA